MSTAKCQPSNTTARRGMSQGATYAWLHAHVALQLILLTLTSITGRGTSLPGSSGYLSAHCAGNRRVYAPLIENQLSPYRSTQGLSVEDVLKLEGAASPQVLVVDGVAMTQETPAVNMAAYWVPLLNHINGKALLPNLIIATDIWDQPEDDTFRKGGPWFGYCNYLFQTTNLMLPAGAGVMSRLRCGKNCEPFTNLDKREAKAVFLGSSTGWFVGRRRAAVLAGILHNDIVYSGYTQMIDLPDSALPTTDEALSHIKPKMELAEQINRYKYIINADGHCAALRLRQLLASDSAVFWVETNQIEWFYPLLQPFVHYIPVRYLNYEEDDPLHDIVTKMEWAERNPKKVASIVRNANIFAAAHLTNHGFTCYSIQMLDRYSKLFFDAHKLRAVAQRGNFSVEHARLDV